MQFHSIKQLVAGLMTIIKDHERLKKELDFLKDKGVISQYKNPHLKFGYDNTRHFIFHPEILNHWIENNYPTHTEKTDPLVARLVAFFTNNNPKLSQSSAAKMIKQYGSEAVEQQLEWLHLRDSAENPLRTFRASLKHDWAVPESAPEPEAWHGDAVDPGLNGNLSEPAIEPETELQKQWAEVLESLEMQMTQATFDGWLKATTLESMDSETWVVGCETSLVKDWLENRLATKIQRTVWLAAGSEDVDVKFIVRRRTILKK